MNGLPERARVYRNHHLDSTRWDTFQPRGGDIVIASSYKSGTTWTQAIIANLLFPDQPLPAPVWRMSPWENRGLETYLQVRSGSGLSGLSHARHPTR